MRFVVRDELVPESDDWYSAGNDLNAQERKQATPAQRPTDDASILTEFETKRGREFYLECKSMGDLRRNGVAALNAPVPGSPY